MLNHYLICCLKAVTTPLVYKIITNKHEKSGVYIRSRRDYALRLIIRNKLINKKMMSFPNTLESRDTTRQL